MFSKTQAKDFFEETFIVSFLRPLAKNMEDISPIDALFVVRMKKVRVVFIKRCVKATEGGFQSMQRRSRSQWKGKAKVKGFHQGKKKRVSLLDSVIAHIYFTYRFVSY